MNETIFGTELTDLSPIAFSRLVERLLLHANFTNVSNTDGSGDGGADLVALRNKQRWVIQVKSKKSKPVDPSAIDELLSGVRIYKAHHGVVVTNNDFTATARGYAKSLRESTGINIGLWNRQDLINIFHHPKCPVRFATPDLRKYQVDAFQCCLSDMRQRGAAYIVLATGLGKTVVAGAVIDRFLADNPNSKILVLADKIELVDQLERAIWRHLPKSVPTQLVADGAKPQFFHGVTVATIQSAISYVRQGFRPDLIFIDEAHHVGVGTNFAQVLDLCPNAIRLGATATPWRGDKFDISEHFGRPSVKIGIEEGMRLGYLVDVDYRLYADNINWDYVQSVSSNSYSISELNRSLFLPQRDEKIRDELLDVWIKTIEPKAIVFCQTVEHAEHMLSVLRGVPYWTNAATIHSEIPKAERRTNLAKFRLGDIPILVAVDVLNEGVDVPDVNIVCFARVTHSRRIFVQQLGRGLRLREGKTHVSVLDFVSDIKRLKAVLDLKSQITRDVEHVVLPSSHSVTFTDVKAEKFFKEWLYDVASLETAVEAVKLNFPPSFHG